MGLAHHKRRQRPGPPEFVAVLLFLATIATAVLWWQQASRARWRETSGVVTELTVRKVHYNATADHTQVQMAYRYTAGSVAYTGSFTGIWPHAQSPNAMTDQEIAALARPGQPLTVYYDPADPSRSRIDGPPLDVPRYFLAGTIGAITLAFLYCARVYPRWKERRYYALARA